MIMDELLEFMDAQAETTQATHNSDSYVDLGATAAAREIGHGEPLYFVVTCDTTPTSGGSATLQFKLVSDSTTTISTDGTESAHFTSDTIAYGSVAAGDTIVCAAVPDGAVWPYERYLGAQLVIGGAALTAGKFNAFLTKDPHRITSLPDATN